MKKSKRLFTMLVTASLLYSQITCYAAEATDGEVSLIETSTQTEKTADNTSSEKESVNDESSTDNETSDTAELSTAEETSNESIPDKISDQSHEESSEVTEKSQQTNPDIDTDKKDTQKSEAGIADSTDKAVTDDSEMSAETFKLPDIVDKAEAKELGFIGRDLSAENNLNTFVFKNKDGTNTMKLYSYPVKYIDENGNTRDISLDIKENGNGGFVTANNEIITTFEKNLSDGVSLCYDDIDITMIPEIKARTAVAISAADTESVEYEADENTSYVYQLTYNGFKEDIIVNEYTGQTDYSFKLYTNGLSVTENSGSFYLTDSSGETKANIGDIIVFTADERNNTFGKMTYKTIKTNEEYLLTIHLDEEYLSDEKTVYPIKIDPSIEVNHDTYRDGGIQDVTINSNAGSDGGLTSLFIGKRQNYGISRVLMKFPKLDMTNLCSSFHVTEAYVEMRDLMCEGEAMSIDSYIFCGNSWNESNASWNTVKPNEYSMLLSTTRVAYNIGVNKDPIHRYKFDITKAVKCWADGNTFDKNKGIIFKAKDSVENGNTYIKKTLASYENTGGGTTPYSPSLTVVFKYGVVHDKFYSRYSPKRYNATDSPESPTANKYTNLMQFRMNCYGYALGYFLKDKALVKLNSDNKIYGYLQQPGEFVPYNKKSLLAKTPNVINSQTIMDMVVTNFKLDANALGYKVEPYYQTSSTIQQFSREGQQKRLIAVVTGDTDFHFYVQHSDGTWSHKPGSAYVTNKSIKTRVILTNDNIYKCANEGAYKGGLLKFFTVTKDAVAQPHTARCCNNYATCSHTSTITVSKDIGDYCETAESLSATTKSGRIDYVHDHDFYNYVSTFTKDCSITATSPDGINVRVNVYNNDGVLIRPVSNKYKLYGGSRYHLDVFTTSFDVPTNYTMKIS